MFTSFFYTMRSNGLNISTTEWLTLMDALDKDLAHSNFTDFYYLCRTIFVKNEGDYDKLDASFLEYFKNIKDKKLNLDQINEWLHTDSEMGEMTGMLIQDQSVKLLRFIVCLEKDLLSRTVSTTVVNTGLVAVVALSLVETDELPAVLRLATRQE